MRIRIHRKALKFLEEIPSDKRSLVEGRLRELLEALERGVPPYRRLDVRKLGGMERLPKNASQRHTW